MSESPALAFSAASFPAAFGSAATLEPVLPFIRHSYRDYSGSLAKI
jgi:hypothetical protein